MSQEQDTEKLKPGMGIRDQVVASTKNSDAHADKEIKKILQAFRAAYNKVPTFTIVSKEVFEKLQELKEDSTKGDKGKPKWD